MKGGYQQGSFQVNSLSFIVVHVDLDLATKDLQTASVTDDHTFYDLTAEV